MTPSEHNPDRAKSHQDPGENRAVHRPVMLRETMAWLDLQEGQSVVDGTVGAGGHSTHILEAIGSSGRLIGLDRDPMMLDLARRRIPDQSAILCHAPYDELPHILQQYEIAQVDRVLLDLGLSSDQLADRSRGFSFDADGPLDLRFDTSTGRSAAEYLADVKESELARTLHEYGEERHNRKIASEIVRQQKTRPVKTANELAAIVENVVPGGSSSKRHPATRTFQALRIAVNHELDHLQNMLSGILPEVLTSKGQAVIITFHSLEDRFVKTTFRDPDLWENLTPTPILPTPAEIRINPRARSAKLRAARRK